jgi:hypothetical protein
MLPMSRRGVLASAVVAAAFGLSRRLEFVSPAHALTPLEPTTGFYRYKVGDIEVTAVYDGIWRKPHDPDVHQERLGRRHQGGARQGRSHHRIHADPADGRGAEDRRSARHGRRGFRRRTVAGERHEPAGQYEGRGDRSHQDQHDPGFAFSSRSRLGPDGERHERRRLPQRRIDRQRRGIQVVDGPGSASRNWPKAAGRPASASPAYSRHGTTGSSSTTTLKWRRAFALSRHTATRPAIRPS